MADVEGVHAEDARDSGVALLQGEPRQWCDAQLFRRHLKHANAQVVNFCCVDPFRRFAAELCRDPRRFHGEPERFNETFVQDGNKRAGIDQETMDCPRNEHGTVSAPLSSRRIGTRTNFWEAAAEPRLIC